MDLSKGLTEEMIAVEWGVSKSIFRRWKNENSELAFAIMRGKNKLLSDLSTTAVRRAKGYSVTEMEEIDDPEKGTITKTKTKFIQSDRMIEFLINKLDNDIEREQDRMLKQLAIEEKQEKIKSLKKLNRGQKNVIQGYTDVTELKEIAKQLLEEGGENNG